MGAFDGNGQFVRSYNWTNDANSSINIEAARMDTEDDGFAGGLSNVICKDGQSTITANLPMSGFKHTNVAIANARNQYAAVSQVQDGALTIASSVSGTDTITMAISLGLNAYTAGQQFGFVAAGTNTGAVTININGLGAKALKKFDNAVDLEAGDIATGQFVLVGYDGTNFQMLSPPKSVVNNTITTAKIVDSAVTTPKIADQNVTTAKISNTLLTGLTAATDLQNADQLILADNSNSDQNRKITLANAKPYLTPITTRGDIIRGSSAGLAERLALGVVGSVPISDGTDVSFGYYTRVITKTADEGKTGSGQNWTPDSALQFVMAANRTYLIDLNVACAHPGVNLDYGWDATGAVSSAYATFSFIHGNYQDTTNYASITSNQISESARTLGLPQNLRTLAVNRSSGNLMARIVVQNSGAANTFRFLWGAEGSTVCTVYAGSTLTYQVIG